MVDEVFSAFLDTVSEKNFISRQPVKRHHVLPVKREEKEILTQNEPKPNTILFTMPKHRRPETNKLKWNYEHTKDRRFYRTLGGECPIHDIRLEHILQDQDRRDLQGKRRRSYC